MTTINVTNARKHLFKLVKEMKNSHEPILINGKDTSAVLISEDDWNAITETLYLISIPGMKDSIKKGMKEPIKKCRTKLDW